MDHNLNETAIQLGFAGETEISVSSNPSVIRGVDGVSPIANVTQTADGARISITDLAGTTTAEVYNGQTGPQGPQGPAGSDGRDGENGRDGFSPVANVTQSGGVTTITITDSTETTTASITVPVLYTTTGQNTDGAVTQKLFTDTVGNIETVLQTLNTGGGAQ